MRTRALAALLAAVLVVPAAAGAKPKVAVEPAPPRIEDRIIIRSYDGTPIVATLMLPGDASATSRVPAILETHGWGGSRRTTPSGTVGRLLERGYAILTWDSRGFGDSGGEAGPGGTPEVRDAQALLDYLAARPEILTDAPGDPRVGWVGGSNAGGVQLNTAAVDRRVDAIAPEIAWGDLVQNLVPNGVPKQTWDTLLYGAGAAGAAAGGLDSPASPQTGVYAEQIHRGNVEINTTQQLSSEVSQWFAERSTTIRSGNITAPTLLVQGSIDTLFPLEDAFDNYANVKAAGTPVKLMAYCSGHTIAGCKYGTKGASDSATGAPVWQDRIVAWMDRWVKGDRTADTGPEVEWQARDGRYYGAPSFPLPGTQTVTGATVKTGTLAGPGATGGDGVANGAPAPAEELGRTAARAVVLPATNTVREVVGVPSVTVTGTVTGVAANVFFELVNVAPDGKRVTLDDQTMPLRLGNGAHRQTIDLHGVAWRLEPGHALELEVTTGSAQYAAPRFGPYSVSLDVTPQLPVRG